MGCNDADAGRSVRLEGKEYWHQIFKFQGKRDVHYAWREIMLLTNDIDNRQGCQ